MHNAESITIQGAIAGLLTMISYYCGIVAVPIIVLVAVMIIDYITGMVAAWKGKELSSKKGAFGIKVSPKSSTILMFSKIKI